MIRDFKDLVNTRESKEISDISDETDVLENNNAEKNKHYIRPNVFDNKRYRAISFHNNIRLGRSIALNQRNRLVSALSPLEGGHARVSFR